ncbi:MAG: transposase [Bacteroidetes bacterium]|nr:transposase [Bacteroidota bacterium]MBU1579689.1 transposase [Bacteroidota bacterium]MBU2558950.1 transposase [Bacteroidota bacterium]
MSRKYKFHNPDGTYFVSFAVQGWVDVFTRNQYKDILIENLTYCIHHIGLEIFAWCIMTNHVHLLARATRQESFSDILRDFKKFTSKAVKKAIQENEKESRKEWLLEQFKTEQGYRFWRSDNKPIEVWSNKVIKEKLNYIHYNPVEEGLVFRPEDYVYSSTVNYSGQNGLL